MNIEKRRECQKRYYERNKDKILLRNKNSYKDNIEQRRLRVKKCNDQFYATLRGKIHLWKNAAKRRKIQWELSNEDIEELAKPMVCFYTNVPLTLERSKPNTISIDRVDSNVGYVKGNVAICQSTINFMKGVLSTMEFIQFCRNVVNHHDRNEVVDYVI